MRSATLWGLTIVCVALSLVGVLVAVVLGEPNHGGRGGAVSVAFSFGFLFLSSLGSYRSIEKFDEAADELIRIVGSSESFEHKVEVNSTRIDKLKSDIDADIRRQRRQNKFLFGVGVFATLVWGFGDILAKYAIIAIN